MKHLSLVKPLVQCSVTPPLIHTHTSFDLAGDDFSCSARQMTTNQFLCYHPCLFMAPLKNEWGIQSLFWHCKLFTCFHRHIGSLFHPYFTLCAEVHLPLFRCLGFHIPSPTSSAPVSSTPRQYFLLPPSSLSSPSRRLSPSPSLPLETLVC